MFDVVRKEIEWAGQTLVLETGKIARQATGSVMVSLGETVVLATATSSDKPREGADFLPLTVNYQEKTFAAGKIPGGFFKREGRPSEKEVLTSRLIDRPIRPLFPSDFRCDTQVIATVLSHDMENDPDIVALVGCYAAVAVARLPVSATVAGARVGLIDGEFVLNPPISHMVDSTLDLICAGTSDAVLMVESEAQELSEEKMLEAVMFAHRGFQPVIKAIEELAAQANKPNREHTSPDFSDLDAVVAEVGADLISTAYKILSKADRQIALASARGEIIAAVLAKSEDYGKDAIKGRIKYLEAKLVRGAILDSGVRIDGRNLETVRPIVSEVKLLPRSHGSALFTRGETQALVAVTLGTAEDEQFVDALDGTYKEAFMLHYNFPPYSVGEAGRLGVPGRREIGHGKLAWRAIRPVLPGSEKFPYTIRVVSEITESNGSSSMATVCGTSLALMDAGVSIERPVAGIAMGLILDADGRFAILSDILGDEDHLGDMDFKVAGTSNGVTSLQMDIKITGITADIMEKALKQAKDGRLHILERMGDAIETPRSEMGEYAPKVISMTIPTEKIRDVIGAGGKIIREIVEKTGAKINIDDAGEVRISSTDADEIEAARKWVHSIVAEPEVGVVYEGRVVKIMDFGAFVNFFGNTDGLVHVSQLAPHRVARVEDVVAEGDTVKVKLLEIDGRGKMRLSMKAVDQNTGEDL